MKNLFLFCSLVIMVSCSLEPVSNAEETEIGYLTFRGKFNLSLPSSKQIVPECTGLSPVKIRYRLINTEGIMVTQESTIQINAPDVISNEPMKFPVGTYTVDEISLLDANDVITHSVPHIDDPIGNLALFENDILPMEITIMPNEATESFVILLCNNTTELEEFESTISSGFIGAMYETKTAWIYVPEDSCVNRIVIDTGYEVEVLIDQPGYYSVQYIRYEGGNDRFEAYQNDQFLEVWHGIGDLHILPNGCPYPL